MKFSIVFKSSIIPWLFTIIILFLPFTSNSYGQERKESMQRQDMVIETWIYTGQTNSDSVLQSLTNKLDVPNTFFNNPFSPSANYGELFNDPFLNRKWLEWPDKDFFYFAPTDSIYNFVNPLKMRTLIQNHQRMIKEIQKYFEFKLPHERLDPDSVFYYHFKDKEYIPIKTFIQNKKI